MKILFMCFILLSIKFIYGSSKHEIDMLTKWVFVDNNGIQDLKHIYRGDMPLLSNNPTAPSVNLVNKPPESWNTFIVDLYCRLAYALRHSQNAISLYVIDHFPFLIADPHGRISEYFMEWPYSYSSVFSHLNSVDFKSTAHVWANVKFNVDIKDFIYNLKRTWDRSYTTMKSQYLTNIVKELRTYNMIIEYCTKDLLNMLDIKIFTLPSSQTPVTLRQLLKTKFEDESYKRIFLTKNSIISNVQIYNELFSIFLLRKLSTSTLTMSNEDQYSIFKSHESFCTIPLPTDVRTTDFLDYFISNSLSVISNNVEKEWQDAVKKSLITNTQLTYISEETTPEDISAVVYGATRLMIYNYNCLIQAKNITHIFESTIHLLISWMF